MKNIKIIAGMLLLAICSSKAVSSDDFLPTFDSDKNGNYALLYEENRKIAGIVLLSDPDTVEIDARFEVADNRMFSINNGGIIRKSRIDGALAIFSERIMKHEDVTTVVIYGMQEPGLIDIADLTPDTDILKELYFSVMPTLQYVEIMMMNNTDIVYKITKNGEKKLLKTKLGEEKLLGKLW